MEKVMLCSDVSDLYRLITILSLSLDWSTWVSGRLRDLFRSCSSILQVPKSLGRDRY